MEAVLTWSINDFIFVAEDHGKNFGSVEEGRRSLTLHNVLYL